MDAATTIAGVVRNVPKAESLGCGSWLAKGQNRSITAV
jgi:hypothetical protein